MSLKEDVGTDDAEVDADPDAPEADPDPDAGSDSDPELELDAETEGDFDESPVSFKRGPLTCTRRMRPELTLESASRMRSLALPCICPVNEMRLAYFVAP